MLETTECIPIKNQGRNYTDCMEFSLLRFLHIIFCSEDEISQKGNSTWVTQPVTQPDEGSNEGSNEENEGSDLENMISRITISPDLNEWIRTHPKIYKKSSYYLEGSDDEELKLGAKEREEWSQFVSDREYFEYYRTDGAELFTNIRNIIIMCKELLGMNLNLEDSEPENLRIISNSLSHHTGKNIKLCIGYKEKDILNMPLSRILNFISKPQPDINELPVSSYKVLNKRTILHLTVGSDVYNWNLYEVYFTKEDLVSNKFITGHSALM